ncbi:MAG: thiol peroxidase [Spirochaetia bacterium]|nr:thiol peroxidase [Spirochaetia bacterium]
MAEIKFKGKPVHTSGSLPEIGTKAHEFQLTTTDLEDITLNDFKGKRILMNIFPSLDTDICAESIRFFALEAPNLENTEVLCISKDLPFAHKRFFLTEGIKNVTAASEMRNRKFGEDYGVAMIDGPLAGLLSRAIVVIDENGVVLYTEQVPEIKQASNYQKAIAALGR